MAVEHDETMAESYRRQGYATVPAVLDADALLLVERHLESVTLTSSGIAACSPERDPVAASVGSHPALATLAEAVLGGRATAFGVTYLVKCPGSSLPVLWHQDGHPWAEQLGVHEAVTVWVALDPSTVDSGCMWVIPGSHHHPARPLAERAEPPNVFGWESHPGMVDEAAAVPVELQPGDVSLHHPAVLHRSGANRTSRRRAALAVRYRRGE